MTPPDGRSRHGRTASPVRSPRADDRPEPMRPSTHRTRGDHGHRVSGVGSPQADLAVGGTAGDERPVRRPVDGVHGAPVPGQPPHQRRLRRHQPPAHRQVRRRQHRRQPRRLHLRRPRPVGLQPRQHRRCNRPCRSPGGEKGRVPRQPPTPPGDQPVLRQHRGRPREVGLCRVQPVAIDPPDQVRGVGHRRCEGSPLAGPRQVRDEVIPM